MAPDTDAHDGRGGGATGYLPAGVGVFLGTAGVLCGLIVFLFEITFLLGLVGLTSSVIGLHLATEDPAQEHRRFAMTAVALNVVAIALALVDLWLVAHAG